eukprot:SAG22_NODE_50_length_24611_cov_74.139687_11_plen_270_part_00
MPRGDRRWRALDRWDGAQRPWRRPPQQDAGHARLGPPDVLPRGGAVRATYSVRARVSKHGEPRPHVGACLPLPALRACRAQQAETEGVCTGAAEDLKADPALAARRMGMADAADFGRDGATHYLDDAQIVSSSPSHIHSVALADDGRVFAWGCGSDGRTGLAALMRCGLGLSLSMTDAWLRVAPSIRTLRNPRLVNRGNGRCLSAEGRGALSGRSSAMSRRHRWWRRWKVAACCKSARDDIGRSLSSPWQTMDGGKQDEVGPTLSTGRH